MSNIIIPASKSLTITNKLTCGNIHEDIITVGRSGAYKYYSYLFFDISAIPSNVSILYAELVLFKTDCFYDDDSNIFGIYPLNDYFSTYSTYNNYPEASTVIQKNFYPLTSKVAVTVSFTQFISLWLKNCCMNTGILLYGECENTLVHFGSSINSDKSLVPFLKVCFNPIINKCDCDHHHHHHYNALPLETVNVTGTVAANSKYEAIINIEVQRSGSGQKNNYYVVDEYNNSSSNLPKHIDKTYDIPVIPKLAPGDHAEAQFYGSYTD